MSRSCRAATTGIGPGCHPWPLQLLLAYLLSVAATQAYRIAKTQAEPFARSGDSNHSDSGGGGGKIRVRKLLTGHRLSPPPLRHGEEEESAGDLTPQNVLPGNHQEVAVGDSAATVNSKAQGTFNASVNGWALVEEGVRTLTGDLFGSWASLSHGKSHRIPIVTGWPETREEILIYSVVTMVMVLTILLWVCYCFRPGKTAAPRASTKFSVKAGASTMAASGGGYPVSDEDDDELSEDNEQAPRKDNEQAPRLSASRRKLLQGKKPRTQSGNLQRGYPKKWRK